MEDLLQVGIITQTHGIKGEVKVFPTTDDPNRFKRLKNVLLDTGKEKIALEIEGVRFFKQFVILKFKEFNNINDVEKYKTKSLLVTRENAVKLRRNEYFIADLMGLEVVTEDGNHFGTLRDVMQTGANDVYIVDMDVEGMEPREVLLPAIKECILNVDMEAQKVTVHIMDGLLD